MTIVIYYSLYSLEETGSKSLAAFAAFSNKFFKIISTPSGLGGLHRCKTFFDVSILSGGIEYCRFQPIKPIAFCISLILLGGKPRRISMKSNFFEPELILFIISDEEFSFLSERLAFPEPNINSIGKYKDILFKYLGPTCQGY